MHSKTVGHGLLLGGLLTLLAAVGWTPSMGGAPRIQPDSPSGLASLPHAVHEDEALSCVPREQCCKVCSKGKACGDSCIRASYSCHKGSGCACDEENLCD